MVTRRIGRSAAWVMLLFMAAAGGVFAAETELQLPSFVTVGTGYVAVPADRVTVSIGIETNGASAEEAHRRNEATIAAIRAALQQAGFPDVTISERGVNMWEGRQPVTGEPADGRSYRATAGLDVTLPADEAEIGRVIDVAMALGASSIQGVQFRSTNIEQAMREALGLAVKDAMSRARTISEATGMHLTMIRRVTDAGEAEVINPSERIGANVGEPPSMPYPVPVRGELLVRVQVTVEFEVALQ